MAVTSFFTVTMDFPSADGSATLATLHEIDDTIIPIGDAPIEGSPATE